MVRQTSRGKHAPGWLGRVWQGAADLARLGLPAFWSGRAPRREAGRGRQGPARRGRGGVWQGAVWLGRVWPRRGEADVEGQDAARHGRT